MKQATQPTPISINSPALPDRCFCQSTKPLSVQGFEIRRPNRVKRVDVTKLIEFDALCLGHLVNRQNRCMK